MMPGTLIVTPDADPLPWLLVSLLVAGGVLIAIGTFRRLRRNAGAHVAIRSSGAAILQRCRPPRSLADLLGRAVTPGGLTISHLLLALLMVAGTAAFFVTLAADILAHGPFTRADALVSTWLHDRARDPFTTLVLLVTWIGAPPCVTLITVATVTLLAIYRRWYATLLVGLAMSGGGLLIPLLKIAFVRARPAFDTPLSLASGYSFPSGHAILAMLLYGVLAYVAIEPIPRRLGRLALLAAATVMIAAIGFSRIYLGVHYLSDVLAGTAAGAAWLILCIVAVETRRLHRRRRRAARDPSHS